MIYLVTKRREEFPFWETFADIDPVLEILRSGQPVQFDTETTGLLFLVDTMWCWQIGDGKDAYVVDQKTYPIADYKKEFEEAEELIGAGIKFDLTFTYKHNIVPKKVWCTIMAERRLSLGVKTWGCGLADQVKRYCGVDLPKDERMIIKDNGLSSKEAVEYAGNDVLYLHEIKERQIEIAKRRKMLPSIENENRYVRPQAYIEFCGMGVDEKRIEQNVFTVEGEAYIAYKELWKVFKENYPSHYMEGMEDVFNWGSPAQVTELFLEIGIDINDRKTKKPNVQQSNIIRHIGTHPIIKPYIIYKKRMKEVGTYGRNWFDLVQENGRIHTKFNQLVSTGRTSCGNINKGPFPNTQNIPNPKEDDDRVGNIRRCMKAIGPYKYVSIDYSAHEQVVFAEKTMEPNLLEFYHKDIGDMHCYVAQKIFPELKNYTLPEIKEKFPDKRKMAKAGGFAIIFGGTGFTIANNLNIPIKEGEYIFDSYMKAFPGLEKYKNDQYQKAMKCGYISINEELGSKRFIEGYRKWRKGKDLNNIGPPKTSFERAIARLCLNTPTQGTAADMMKMAISDFFDWIIENKRFGKTKIVNMVHDEVVLEEHNKRCEETAEIMRGFMIKASKVFLKELTLDAHYDINKYWN